MRILATLACLGLLFIAAPAHADRDSAIAALRQQAPILESRIDDRGTVWAIVKPEKKAWGQYAAALCAALVPHQARIFTVKVIDVSTVGRGRKPAEWTVLGQAACGAQ